MIEAGNLQDLAASHDEREVLWRSLREKAIHSGEYTTKDLPEFPVDPLILELLGKITAIKESRKNAQLELE
jgi:hypothetical protein